MIPLVLVSVLAANWPPVRSAYDVLGGSGPYRVDVHRVGVKGSARQTVNLTLDVARPNTLVVRVESPAQGSQLARDRRFELRGGRLAGYDARADERIARSIAAPGSLSDRLASALGGIDDMLRISLNPASAKEFDAALRKSGGWQVSRRNGLVDVRRSGGPGVREFAVDSRGLLRRMEVFERGTTVKWTVDYRRQTRPVRLAIPASAHLVESFTELPALPKFASKEAERVVLAMLRAQADLKGTIRVSGDGGSGTLYVQGAHFGERRSDLEWTYDGRTLTIRSPQAHRFFRGAAHRYEVTDFVSRATGSRVDPLLRQILAHEVPLQDLLPPNGAAKVIGSSSVDGVPADILTITAPQRRTSLFVRRPDHLVGSVSTDTIDFQGRTVASSNRRFTYRATIPTGAFSLSPRAGERVEGLGEGK